MGMGDVRAALAEGGGFHDGLEREHGAPAAPYIAAGHRYGARLMVVGPVGHGDGRAPARGKSQGAGRGLDADGQRIAYHGVHQAAVGRAGVRERHGVEEPVADARDVCAGGREVLHRLRQADLGVGRHDAARAGRGDGIGGIGVDRQRLARVGRVGHRFVRVGRVGARASGLGDVGQVGGGRALAGRVGRHGALEGDGGFCSAGHVACGHGQDAPPVRVGRRECELPHVGGGDQRRLRECLARDAPARVVQPHAALV